MVSQHDIEQAGPLLKATAPAGSRVVLFGSYAKGCANEHSDVDFMVIEPELRRIASGNRSALSSRAIPSASR